MWEEKQREILSPLVVGTPVVNTNHTLSKGKRPLAVDEDDGGGLAESSKKKKRSKSAAHVHEEGNADDDDESSETTRTSLNNCVHTLLNMSSNPVDNVRRPRRLAAAVQERLNRRARANDVISAGYYHSLAVRADGSVACWGANTFGKAPPAGVEGDFVAVAAGNQHD